MTLNQCQTSWVTMVGRRRREEVGRAPKRDQCREADRLPTPTRRGGLSGKTAAAEDRQEQGAGEGNGGN
ncbi:MAG: hypothetical protein MPW14_05940 [Candidatus Manganitrophus sp.]|nr:MAG: hypothetical protein MPW14_05940 [Candidatus Manganitrophus sp.]